MASALSMGMTALKSFQPDASVYAGGGAAILTYAAICGLAAAGLSIPVLNIPITMAMAGPAAIAIGHIVTSFVSPTTKQAIDTLAKKVDTTAATIKAALPQTYAEYPADKTILGPVDDGSSKG